MRNLSAQAGSSSSFFQLYPDPVYSRFEDEDGVKYYKSDYLTINVSGGGGRRGGRAAGVGGGEQCPEFRRFEWKATLKSY